MEISGLRAMSSTATVRPAPRLLLDPSRRRSALRPEVTLRMTLSGADSKLSSGG